MIHRAGTPFDLRFCHWSEAPHGGYFAPANAGGDTPDFCTKFLKKRPVTTHLPSVAITTRPDVTGAVAAAGRTSPFVAPVAPPLVLLAVRDVEFRLLRVDDRVPHGTVTPTGTT